MKCVVTKRFDYLYHALPKINCQMRDIDRNILIEHYFTITLDRKGMRRGVGEWYLVERASTPSSSSILIVIKLPKSVGWDVGHWGLKSIRCSNPTVQRRGPLLLFQKTLYSNHRYVGYRVCYVPNTGMCILNTTRTMHVINRK